jgi:hypothetical protein
LPSAKIVLIDEAARLLIQGGIYDPLVAVDMAKRKFPEDRVSASTCEKVEAAAVLLAQRQNVEKYARDLQTFRCVALNAIRFFAPFKPRAFGAVISGALGMDTPVEILLYADSPILVPEFLVARGIRFRQSARALSFARDKAQLIDCLSFVAENITIELLIVPTDAERKAVFRRRHADPLRRISEADLVHLIGEGEIK